MLKRGMILGLLLLMVVPLISSENIDFRVETYTSHDIEVNFIVGPPVTVLKSVREPTGDTGIVDFTFSTTQESFDMTAFVKQGNEVVLYKRFDDILAAESYTLKLFKNEADIITGIELVDSENETTIQNETENETVQVVEANETQDSQEDNSPSITGLSTTENAGSGSFFSNTSFYYIIGIAVLGFAVFMGVFKTRSRGEKSIKEPKKIKVKKLSELKEEKENKGDKFDEYKKALEDAEKRVEDLRGEIGKLKNKEKVEELKKKMEQDQKELDKLLGEKPSD